jgi:hypothetical protein
MIWPSINRLLGKNQLYADGSRGELALSFGPEERPTRRIPLLGRPFEWSQQGNSLEKAHLPGREKHS